MSEYITELIEHAEQTSVQHWHEVAECARYELEKLESLAKTATTPTGDFLTELKALLTKHNASINFCVSESSDTYGINGEKMVISVGTKTVAEVDGWGINANDLEVK